MVDKNDSDDEDMILAAAAAAMAAGVVCIAAFEIGLFSKTSSGTTDYSSSSSSGSTGRTKGSGKRRHELLDQVENLSSRIGETTEAIKSRRKDFSSTLYLEIMKSVGYDELSLGKAFDYLLEHENRARAFLAKNDTLRKAWLSDFFSSSDKKGGVAGKKYDKINQFSPGGSVEDQAELDDAIGAVDADAGGDTSSAAETTLVDASAANEPVAAVPLTMLPPDAPRPSE